MSIPALRALRTAHPNAHIAILARPWVADLYAREDFCGEIIPYDLPRGWKGWPRKLRFARTLQEKRFDCAILLPNSFEAALLVWLARIPVRIGYRRDARGWLLTSAVPRPAEGEVPRREHHYYVELLRRAHLIPSSAGPEPTLLSGAAAARQRGLQRFESLGIMRPVVGISPGSAYGTAKQWLPERFAEAGLLTARALEAQIVLFGSAAERELCERIVGLIRARDGDARNLAGETQLSEFIGMAAACYVFLTNDSGPMHIASALGVPTVAVFGSTDDIATGPSGPRARVVREPVECSPCLLRECPIDHRCMTRVPAARVTQVALDLVKLDLVRLD